MKTKWDHILYDDFVSLVENSNPATYWQDNEKNANENFKFVDMEFGKIYVFKDRNPDYTWFLTPVDILSEDNYFVHWGYYSPGSGKMSYHKGRGSPARNREWEGMVWSGKRWLTLEYTTSFKYMNWLDENPLEVKE